MSDSFGIYRVSGCGVSMICDNQASIREWCFEILQRGGWPTVSRLSAIKEI